MYVSLKTWFGLYVSVWLFVVFERLWFVNSVRGCSSVDWFGWRAWRSWRVERFGLFESTCVFTVAGTVYTNNMIMFVVGESSTLHGRVYAFDRSACLNRRKIGWGSGYCKFV